MSDEKPSSQNRSLEYINIDNKPFFPISWLHKQDFCEYQIYLENVKGIKVEPTKAMIDGKEEHEKLYEEFKVSAVHASVDEALISSKTQILRSRELRVKDTLHGIYGRIDEALLIPDKFVIIDDKPGTRTYDSNINQVYGYCLAFKELLGSVENRPIIAALRERGTDNIYWKQPFNLLAEQRIIGLVEYIHALMVGDKAFNSTDNPNKCRGCKLKKNCDRVLAS